MSKKKDDTYPEFEATEVLPEGALAKEAVAKVDYSVDFENRWKPYVALGEWDAKKKAAKELLKESLERGDTHALAYFSAVTIVEGLT